MNWSTHTQAWPFYSPSLVSLRTHSSSNLSRYNPENIATLERYVELQARENTYDLEANLALLKLYQFNPGTYQSTVACQILMKALTNLPHTDFVLCKCLLGQDQVRAQRVGFYLWNCQLYLARFSIIVISAMIHFEVMTKLIYASISFDI